MNPIIVTENLNFYYHKEHALKDINIAFNQEKVTAIIGPSGSGKSTLLRTFNRIYSLYPKLKVTGKVYFKGKNILRKNTNLIELRCKVGMVFQKPTPFPMSIYDNVAFALKLHMKASKAEIQDRVEHALKQAALWDEVKDKLREAGTHLSGGQQQRLCIARSIAIEPEILLLDEPTSSLDPIATAKVEELITELKNKYTIILVTHNLKQAQRISDETIFMKQGQIIEHRNTHDLFNQAQHDATRAYIEEH